MKNQQSIHNISLQAPADQLKVISQQFTLITFSHVFQELNALADALSKEGLHTISGVLFLDESIVGAMTVSNLSVYLSLITTCTAG
jgi:hypothetical protein